MRWVVLLALLGVLAPAAKANVWTAGTNYPVDPNSAAMVSDLTTTADSEMTAGTGPWINTDGELLVVSDYQATTKVTITCNGCANETALQADMNAVPLPSPTYRTNDSDRETVVQQGDHQWEFWQLGWTAPAGWTASWGGYVPHVSTDPGYFSAATGTFNFGAAASGLPLADGLMTLTDLKAGVISHALAMNVPWARKNSYVWPAQRDDGQSTDPNSLPEGTMLRLDPAYNVAGLAQWPLVEQMALAAQKYGIIVRDQTASAIGFWAQDGTPYNMPTFYYDTSGNPSTTGPFHGLWPSVLMEHFPWSHLQVVDP